MSPIGKPKLTTAQRPRLGRLSIITKEATHVWPCKQAYVDMEDGSITGIRYEDAEGEIVHVRLPEQATVVTIWFRAGVME